MRTKPALSSRFISLSYLAFYALNAPLFAIYSLMAFILHSDFRASVTQITILIVLKPTVAVISVYWNDFFSISRGCIRTNILGAVCIGAIPTFFFPCYNSGWQLVCAFGVYFFAERAICLLGWS